ncbi:hypothetical protein SAMN05216189_102914 [Pseudomonas delhiensis]|uniref:Uncharacterized protein n=2 Tax=Pseudomonas delhiensis TaxID=366289 RepID=A0A239IVX0_9PSED|nr:hypothetical protein SAMN05216189_102914 [Pseudomonas delhiensis]SNS97532.1 hypothetical protein SAMN06295949_11115 [Pseudomonas delhiensis]
MTGAQHSILERPYSILTTSNGSIWYGCGSFSSNFSSIGVSAILAYSPSHLTIDLSPTKVRYVDNRPIWKVFSAPDPEYQQVLKKNESVIAETFGRVAILRKNEIIKSVEPCSISQKFLDSIGRQSVDFLHVLSLLEIEIEEIGISGSCGAFSPICLQHEVDICFFGSEKCQRIWHRIRELLDKKIFMPADKYEQRFRYGEIEFDPQFSRSNSHQIMGFGEISNISIAESMLPISARVVDASESIFFPAYYKTTAGPLISFRVGHRGLFSSGEIIKIHDPVKLMLTVNGKETTAIGVVGRSWIS